MSLSSSEHHEASRWFRANGLPLVILPQERIKEMFVRITPLGLWLSVTLFIVTISVAILAHLDDKIFVQEDTTDDIQLEIIKGIGAFVLLFGGPLVALVIPWLVLRFKRKTPQTLFVITGSMSILSIMYLLSPSLSYRMGIGEPLFFSSSIEVILCVLAILLALFLGLDSILWWAFKETLVQLGSAMIMIAKVLPMLMVAVLFFFVNAEIWKVADALSYAKTFAVSAVMFTLALFIVTTTVIERSKEVLGDHQGKGIQFSSEEYQRVSAESTSFWNTVTERIEGSVSAKPLGVSERINFILVPAMVQCIQAVMFSIFVFLFFVWFGSFAIPSEAAASWINHTPENFLLFGVELPVSSVLVKVSIVLGAFSGLSFAASTSTDECYMHDFLEQVFIRLRQQVLIRNIYRSVYTAS
ncbi:hypothetical protein ACN081_05225 [Rothia sp. P13129]|uniref:hypothetical protein n=1 Tax=Rothia sp. P13129 TaxID=3402664 RepID=UPI003ABF2767